MPEEPTHREAEEQAPSTAEKAPDVAIENAPSTSSPEATAIPTANTPDPEAASPDNPNAAKAKVEPGDKPAEKRSPKADAADGKPAAKPKKEKAPALEDKPFADFIQQDFLPALKAGLEKQGISDAALLFEKRKINVVGFSHLPETWQVICRWSSGYKQTREFNLYFFDENINGQKGFSYSESGGRPSTLESFRIDERKFDLGLLVFWTLQRVNAQKWLVRN
ncbi:DUF2996 domain-containing protein [Leptolyngbya sp. FACHB-36]|uniref:DUF2996 domain-containing protein n=1 Tax=Leptolyngbya sp. FACHB-36 TaxID=2692808 RepID=UPI0016806EA8|nr:DUF2996 domain-containing protein [Leptolyngbya sp. FACHB-36]MBD2020928.1 DUF2996 domain-containing protein [Leptolyngbya sp. FACHB-36]